jgi:hypothetical protein
VVGVGRGEGEEGGGGYVILILGQAALSVVPSVHIPTAFGILSLGEIIASYCRLHST